jgi:hypothetical protein
MILYLGLNMGWYFLVRAWFFTTKGSMSAQRAQRECSCSLGVQEFGDFFALLCGSLCGLGGKKTNPGIEVYFYHRGLQVGAKGTEGM